ncbi:probable cytochrome P450 6g2 [Anopheles stephensi]|uniref:probable cytochrome P450 6g2 n=1 Tax=Anopheles stephensi TaxID=30069 RepID=UPI001658B666|nr:probable cytochrome P450 6g2 [Anopheles stephensi]XP_035895849.1 probable cytochrome P450 6g2 [Anopheles stephensi]
MLVSGFLLAGLFYHNPLLAVPVFGLVWLLYWLVRHNYQFWEIDGVPHPKPSLFTGNLGPTLTLKKHICELASDWYNAFPDKPFVGYFKIFTPAIMVKDPVLVKNILTRDFECFAANDFLLDVTHDPLLAHEPFMVSGDRWKRARSLLTPSFTGAKIKQLFPVMQSVTDAFVAFIGRHVAHEFEAKEVAARFTTQNVVACTFSIDGDCFSERESEFRRMGRRVFETSHMATIKTMMAVFLPTIAKWIPVPFLLKEVDQWIRSLVANLIIQRSATQQKDSEPEDFLQSFLKSRDKNNTTQTEITAQALTVFLEGFETSSVVLGFALYRLAKSSEVQQKLHDEVKKHIDANDGNLDFDVLLQMEYLEWVMLETLRMHPPAATMHKVCTKKYIMRKGFRDATGHDMSIYVREGTPILIPVLAIHMDPKYYPEPQTFDPERFSPDRKVTHEGAIFLPFGEGPRMCLGMRFAQAQVKLALAKLVLNYRVTVGPTDKPFAIDSRSFVYQARDGLRIVFEKR